jgi:serine/threonine protein kinase
LLNHGRVAVRRLNHGRGAVRRLNHGSGAVRRLNHGRVAVRRLNDISLQSTLQPCTTATESVLRMNSERMGYTRPVGRSCSKWLWSGDTSSHHIRQHPDILWLACPLPSQTIFLLATFDYVTGLLARLNSIGAYELDRYQANDTITTSAGTTPFQPPEVANSETRQFCGGKVDVWAAGVTLWNMTTG